MNSQTQTLVAIHIGALRLTGPTMVVSDPCYVHERSTQLAYEIPSPAGMYDVYAIHPLRANGTTSGLTVAAFATRRSHNTSDTPALNWTTPVEIWNDTGRIGFYDANRTDDPDMYDRTPSQGAVDTDAGVVTSSGYGDGCYAIQHCTIDQEVQGVLVTYLPEIATMPNIIESLKPLVTLF